MTDLSPAAQAVLDAAMNTDEDLPYEYDIAAVLRAAAHQMTTYQSKKFLLSIADEMKLLAIAAELEANRG